MSVNFDKAVVNDGYVIAFFAQRYSYHRFMRIIVYQQVTKPVEQPVQPSTITVIWNLHFQRTSVKAGTAGKTRVTYYDAGMSVNYDRLVIAGWSLPVLFMSAMEATADTLLLMLNSSCSTSVFKLKRQLAPIPTNLVISMPNQAL